MAQLILKLSTCKSGLRALAIINNEFGPESICAFIEHLMQSSTAKTMRKLIIIDPSKKFGNVFGKMKYMPKLREFSHRFKSLRSLVMQKINLDSSDMISLAEAVKNMTSLRELDISSNKLDASMLL